MADTVRDVMSESPWTIEPSDSVEDAAQRMRDEDVGALLVVDDEELKGIVTDRDIVVKAVAEGDKPGKAKIEDVCTADTTTIEADASIDDAIKAMREADVRRLPVVEDGKPVGIVSLGDLAIERDKDSALADISAAAPNN
ncbi:MAG TPA: CBS domain-containing protein [Thermoleophilaceae bacterium]|nr:CBS domain-containing protein [Thermoleophilaceae bacterium]